MKTLVQMETTLTKAYNGLSEAQERYSEVSQNVYETEREIKVRINQAVADGRIQGKNQTERDAATEALFSESLAMLESLKSEEMSRRSALELARIEVEYARTLLRLLEIGHESKG